MAGINMSDTFVLDSTDPVDVVMRTDETYDNAIASVEVNGSSDATQITTKLQESGIIIENADKDATMTETENSFELEQCMKNAAALDESTLDLSNPIDAIMFAESDICDDGEPCTDPDIEIDGSYENEYSDDDDFNEDEYDGDIVDEVLNDTTDEPGSVEDSEDNDMIENVADDKLVADATGYEVEESAFGHYSMAFEACSGRKKVKNDTVNMIDDDDEAINELKLGMEKVTMKIQLKPVNQHLHSELDLIK